MASKSLQDFKEEAVIYDARIKSCISSSYTLVEKTLRDRPYLTTITISVCLSSAYPDISKLIDIVNACRDLGSGNESLRDSMDSTDSTDSMSQIKDIRGFIDQVFGGFEYFFPKKKEKT